MTSAPSSENYFDEAYFQRGWERGTAYENYKENAAVSPIFKGVARAISMIFTPQKALEIGCATGSIVAELNRLGVDTFGIDVSTWAVENAMHDQVLCASVTDLPFETDTFDCLYSSHALEHLPKDIFEAAFREMDRVCGADAVQFHMLPIIGTYPYNYDAETARTDLRKDPTHSLLETMEWWHARWNELGWEALPISILFSEDTANAELSSGQFCLVRKGSERHHVVLTAISAWNGISYRQKYGQLRDLLERRAETLHFSAEPDIFPPRLGPADSRWDDIKREFSTPIDMTEAEITALVRLDSKEDIQMRIALISESGDVVEKWLSISPGLSIFTIDAHQFSIVSGSNSVDAVRSVYFGGTVGDFVVECNLRIRGRGYQIESVLTN